MEKEKKNYTVVIAVVIGVLLILGVLLTSEIISFKDNSTENTVDVSNAVVDDDNNLLCKEEIDKHDNSVALKANIVDNSVYDATKFSKKYSSDTTYEFTTGYCISPETTFVFEIKDGILSLTNKSTGDVSTLEGITNFKSLVYVNLYTSFYSHKLYLLTEDGKLYQSTISPKAYIYDVNNISKIFQLVELSVSIKEIGVMETVDVPATSELLLMKDENDIEYYGLGGNAFTRVDSSVESGN